MTVLVPLSIIMFVTMLEMTYIAYRMYRLLCCKDMLLVTVFNNLLIIQQGIKDGTCVSVHAASAHIGNCLLALASDATISEQLGQQKENRRDK